MLEGIHEIRKTYWYQDGIAYKLQWIYKNDYSPHNSFSGVHEVAVEVFNENDDEYQSYYQVCFSKIADPRIINQYTDKIKSFRDLIRFYMALYTNKDLWIRSQLQAKDQEYIHMLETELVEELMTPKTREKLEEYLLREALSLFFIEGSGKKIEYWEYNLHYVPIWSDIKKVSIAVDILHGKYMIGLDNSGMFWVDGTHVAKVKEYLDKIDREISFKPDPDNQSLPVLQETLHLSTERKNDLHKTQQIVGRESKDINQNNLEKISNALGKLVFFAVGIDNYEGYTGFPNLNVCSNDAESIGNLLITSPPFQADLNRSYTLTSQSQKELPSKGTILGKLRTILDSTTSEDRFLFFYSGHGYRLNKDSSKFLLVPQDLYDEDDENAYIDFDFVLQILKNAPAKQKIILLDACMSGSLNRTKGPLSYCSLST